MEEPAITPQPTPTIDPSAPPQPNLASPITKKRFPLKIILPIVVIVILAIACACIFFITNTLDDSSDSSEATSFSENATQFAKDFLHKLDQARPEEAFKMIASSTRKGLSYDYFSIRFTDQKPCPENNFTVSDTKLAGTSIAVVEGTRTCHDSPKSDTVFITVRDSITGFGITGLVIDDDDFLARVTQVTYSWKRRDASIYDTMWVFKYVYWEYFETHGNTPPPRASNCLGKTSPSPSCPLDSHIELLPKGASYTIMAPSSETIPLSQIEVAENQILVYPSMYCTHSRQHNDTVLTPGKNIEGYVALISRSKTNEGYYNHCNHSGDYYEEAPPI